MRILLSNDDGVLAPGLEILHRALKKVGHVTVVAPMQERSTSGHNLTLHKPLRLMKLPNGFYGVSGSPADCVYLGLRKVMKGKTDLVVSGINRGANLGQDTFYSGTVSAAREACIMGIPAFAVSLSTNFHRRVEDKALHFRTAGDVLVDVIKKLDWKDMPRGTLVNVNVPDVPKKKIKGFRVAKQGFQDYGGDIIERLDHRGRPYYWVGGNYRGFHKIKGSDCQVVSEGYVSLTPLQLDCTDPKYFRELARHWTPAAEN
ncbi:MAG TPA: 5'/3'-nucleotidase SurE [Bdellovibrionota bacterium]|jgi:5'-nucleotidase|nr:5'/3'-nucleotidase SurE [Bdellovibrionota bacterium]